LVGYTDGIGQLELEWCPSRQRRLVSLSVRAVHFTLWRTARREISLRTGLPSGASFVYLSVSFLMSSVGARVWVKKQQSSSAKIPISSLDERLRLPPAAKCN